MAWVSSKSPVRTGLTNLSHSSATDRCMVASLCAVILCSREAEQISYVHLLNLLSRGKKTLVNLLDPAQSEQQGKIGAKVVTPDFVDYSFVQVQV